MYRDSEQSFGDYTFDVYMSCTHPGMWICDWWLRSNPAINGEAKAMQRKQAVYIAEQQIKELQQ